MHIYLPDVQEWIEIISNNYFRLSCRTCLSFGESQKMTVIREIHQLQAMLVLLPQKSVIFRNKGHYILHDIFVENGCTISVWRKTSELSLLLAPSLLLRVHTKKDERVLPNPLSYYNE